MTRKLVLLSLWMGAALSADPLKEMTFAPRLEIRNGKVEFINADQSPRPPTETFVLKNRDRANLLRSFNLMAETELGREILTRFLPEYNAGRITIEPMSPAAAAMAHTAEGMQAVALFERTHSRQTIYVDNSAPMGALVPILFHEMVHSVDPEFKRTFEESQRLRSEAPAFPPAFGNLGVRPRGGRLFPSLAEVVQEFRRRYEAYQRAKEYDQYRGYLAEVEAHKGMKRLITQLEKLHPGYTEYLETREASGQFTFPLRSRRAILEGYGLNPLSVLRFGTPSQCGALLRSVSRGGIPRTP